MNEIFPVVLAHELELSAGFEHAIRIAMHETRLRSTKPAPEEPDFVAMLVLEGVPYIADALRAVARPYGIRSTVSSAFCHQKPMVEFNRKQDRCELGDVLIVHRHSNRVDGKTYNNALLLQAKMSSGGAYEIPSSERHQLRLYENWPRFTFSRSGPKLNGQVRDIKPKERHAGAQYLLIDSGGAGRAASGMLGFPGTHCMAVWPAMPVLHPHYSLAGELVRFLVGITGRPFADRASDDPSGWSTLVWDLLEHSLSFVFNRKNIGVAAGSRFGGDPMTSALTGRNFCLVGDDASPASAGIQRLLDELRIRTSRHGSVPPIDGNLLSEAQDNPGGVSVILIETRDPDIASRNRG